MPKMHIVQGGVENGDKKRIEQAARTPKTIRAWVAPSITLPGDEIVIYIGGIGLFATATATSAAKRRADWKNRFGADIGQLRLIQPPISIPAILEAIPDLAWANYPRSITTPSDPVARRIRQLVASRKRTKLPESITEKYLDKATLEELRAVALLSARARVPGHTSKTIRYARSVAIHNYVLRRSAGYCEGCGSPAPFLTSKGEPYLEPHHITRVADGGPDHPRRVIGLCPNCHRRAHSAADRSEFKEKLKRKLERLEPSNVA